VEGDCCATLVALLSEQRKDLSTLASAAPEMTNRAKLAVSFALFIDKE